MRSDELLLSDLLDAIESIESYIKNLDFKSFQNSQLVRDGVIRQLTIIGEAASHLSESTKRKIQIPWSKAIAMRNILIHEYFDVDLAITWKTVNGRIQELKKEIKKYLRSKQ